MKRITTYLTISIFFLSCDPSKDGLEPTITGNTVVTQGLEFIPDLINCNVGDTVFFELTPSHNAVQVSEATYQNNGGTPLDGGFNIDYGQSGYFVPESTGTYYYVCQPHLPGMKGRIIVQ